MLTFTGYLTCHYFYCNILHGPISGYMGLYIGKINTILINVNLYVKEHVTACYNSGNKEREQHKEQNSIV